MRPTNINNMGALKIVAKFSIFLLLISNANTLEKTDGVQEIDETNSQENKNDEKFAKTQGDEVIDFEKQTKNNIKNVESSEFCDKEKEVYTEDPLAPSQSLNNQESMTEANDDNLELKIDKIEDTVSRPDLEFKTKTLTDTKESVDSEDESQEAKSRENFNKDVKDTKISNTKSVVIENEEVKDENRVNGGNIEIMKNTSESNSTLYQWLKFILDPFIEEFRDGIYPKLSDKTNITLSNTSIVNESITVENGKMNITTSELKNTNETENNTTDTGKKVKFQCTGKNVTENTNATVKLITTAQLLQLLNFDKNDTDNVTDCLLVMFYAPWCHFCAKVAPHYNALARAFPQLDFVAVDTAQFSNLLARFGTVSVPNILVFHQSRAAVKFNQTDRTFENFVTFVTNSTGLEANQTVNVTDADFLGPVPSVPTNEPDYLLLVSWLFVIFCSSCMFVKSNKGQQWINRVRILWQEHQHID